MTEPHGNHIRRTVITSVAVWEVNPLMKNIARKPGLCRIPRVFPDNREVIYDISVHYDPVQKMLKQIVTPV